MLAKTDHKSLLALSERGLHRVARGLYLKVSEHDTKSWVFRYRDRATGKQRWMGLGAFPERLLSDVKDHKPTKGAPVDYRGPWDLKRCRETLHRGLDPITERERERAELRAGAIKVLSFDEAARQCHETRSGEFRNGKHRDDWISSLNRYASPIIGKLSVADIELPHILEVLKPIWSTKTETATRVRQRLEAVLSWATTSGYRAGLNPARWKGNLENVLPRPAKIRKVQHMKALPWQTVGGFMADLRKREGMAARALEFAILTAARSGEVRLATWDEIDVDAKLWTIPGERMKAGLEHKVPLSERAIQLLNALPSMEGSPYVFPAPKGGPLSDMSISAVCRRMEVEAVPHGFRSSFKDWCRNSTSFPDEVSELALAHVNSDATRAAYARDELLPKRAKLMDAWAKFCATVPAQGDVVPIKAGTAKTE